MDCIVAFRTISSLDTVLPLLFELNKAGFVSRPLFVAWNRETFEFIKKNLTLYDGIRAIGGRLTCLGRTRNRYLNQLLNLFILRKYLFRQILTVETDDLGSFSFSFVSSLNRKVWKGKIIKTMISNRPYRMAKSVIDNYRVVMGGFANKVRAVKNRDIVLLNHSKEEREGIYNEKLLLNCPIILVGYTRGLAEWQGFLNRNIERYLPKAITTPYFFFVLTYVSAWLPGEDCPPGGEVLKECLLVMKEFNDEILTVFKPHQNTDMVKVREILEETGYSNYLISYGHPAVLMKKAKFTFSYTGSSVLIDAYYQGCPTVEYAHYDSRFFEFNNGQPRYFESVDFFVHSDRRKLREVLIKVIRKDAHVERDFKKIAGDFPVMSHQEIKKAFGGLLGKMTHRDR